VLTEEQADALLAAWDERLRRVDESLLALEGDSTWQLIAPDGRLLGTLEGQTRAEVAPAVEAMSRLFEDRERLVAIVEQARGVRATLSSLAFWQNEEKLAQVEALLTGPSISLGAELTPLSRRSLLDPGPREVAISPEELVARMTNAFETTRNLTARLSRAWAKLEPALEEIERELQLLERAPERQLLDADPEARAALAALAAEVNAQRTQVARDPLGVEGNLRSAIAPQLATVRARLAARRELADRVEVALAGVAGARRALRECFEAAHAAYTKLAREVTEPAARARPKPTTELQGLEDWLATLGKTIAAGKLSAAEVGLARWREEADKLLVEAREATRIAEKSLAIRDEMRGRVSARQAQLRALAGRGVDVARAQALVEAAERLAGRTPTDVAAARSAVEALDIATNSLGRGQR
jgi:hypothetical protein